MMVHIGKHKEYSFLQTNQDGLDIKTFIEEFTRFLLERGLAVLSFDGDSLKPTQEHYKRGWAYDELEVAYFSPLNRSELKNNIWDNSYEEWYLFNSAKKLNSNKIFVTYSGFRLIDHSDSASMKNLQNVFWHQIEINNPDAFILNGDNFIYGSKNQDEIEELKNAWS